jgi:hypothetical protein
VTAVAQDQLNRLRYNALLIPATAGPAVLFALIWAACNRELRYIGEGFGGPGFTFAAGLLCWIWLALSRLPCPENQSPPSLHAVAAWVATHLAVSPFSIFGGRVLFSLIPPFSNDYGAILGLLIGYFITEAKIARPTEKYETQRGTVVLSDAEADRQEALLKKTAEPPIRWAGREYPAQIAFGNIAVAGAVGTGKTLMHRELIASVVPHIKPGSDRRAIIYDVKSDLLAELKGMDLSCDILIMNPFDRRSVAWDIASDISTPARARQFAHALIPNGTDEDSKFFASAARSVITGVINALNKLHRGNWTLRDLINITADRKLMERLLGPDSRLVKQFFYPDKTFSNVINQIATVMSELEPVAALWHQKNSAPKLSLREWVERGDSILVLGGNEDNRESLQILNRAMLKIVTAAFFTLGESQTKTRMWFFCDELADAGRLDGLPALLNARSKGVRCVLGFQDFEGLFIGYESHDQAKAIVGKCDTISWLHLSNDETAEWASKRTGKVERLERMDSVSKDGVTTGEHLAERDAILASEFMGLPIAADGIVDGFHMIRGINGIVRRPLKFEYKTLDRADDFWQQPKSVSQELMEWNDADAARLQLDQDDDIADPPPSAGHDPKATQSKTAEFDIDDIPRVHLH